MLILSFLASLSWAQVGFDTTDPGLLFHPRGDTSIVPLRRGRDFYYLPATLAKTTPAWFILDTGSYRSYLTRKGHERLRASGYPVRKDGEIGPLPVQIGGQLIGSTTFALDTVGFPKSLDASCDGILGLDLLSKNRVGLDMASGELCVYPARMPIKSLVDSWLLRKQDRQTGPAVKVFSTDLWDFGDRTYAVQVDMDNLSLPMCLDTGCIESYLSRELAPALYGSKKVGSGNATFEFGADAIDYYRISQYGLGGLPLAARAPIGATKVTNVPGLLGCDVLESLRILLDFPGGKIYFCRSDWVGISPKDKPAVAPSGPAVSLPTDVTIRWPRGVVVRVEPGCTYAAPPGYRKINRPDGTFDLVPPHVPVPSFRPKPRFLVVPTIEGRPCWPGRVAHVPQNASFTAPPGWKALKLHDGSLDLHPPK